MQNIQQFYGSKQLEIRQLSNQELLSQTKVLVQKERNLHIQILRHLREIESRKLYFSQGFSSLFDYTVRELGYSEGAAYRRIKAMRLCRDMPETEARLQSGRLSLSSACQLQSFFEKQKKKLKQDKSSYGTMKQTRTFQEGSIPGKAGLVNGIQPAGDSEDERPQNLQNDFKNCSLLSSVPMENRSAKSLSFERKQDLIKKTEGCSTRETERLLSEADPSLAVPREQARFLGKDRVEIKAVIDREYYRKLEELNNLLSHKNPSLSYGKLFMILVDEGLKRHDPGRKSNKKQGVEANTTAVSVTSAPKLEQGEDILLTSVRKLKGGGSVWVTSTPKLRQSRGVSVRRKSTIGVNEKLDTVKPRYGRLIQRTISAKIRRDIWTRDQGRCAYVHPETGKRCDSKYLLQVDHIRPFALGGSSEKENLRLLCAGHNRFRSGKTFSRK